MTIDDSKGSYRLVDSGKPHGDDAEARDHAADSTSRPLGAADELDVALLQLHRLTLAATVHAGNTADPVLTPTQIRVLTLLAAAPDGMSVTGVAEALPVSQPSASRLCQRLVRDGLVDRLDASGRYVRLSLSRSGKRVLARVNAQRAARLRRIIDEVPERRAVTIRRALVELGRAAASSSELW